MSSRTKAIKEVLAELQWHRDGNKNKYDGDDNRGKGISMKQWRMSREKELSFSRQGERDGGGLALNDVVSNG